MEKICREYYDVVFRYLLTLTKNYDLAEELTQNKKYGVMRLEKGS